MKYIVPKGKHFSRLFKWIPGILPKFFLHPGYYTLTCDIVVTESMFYDDSTLGEDKYDVNKIIGFSRGNHKVTSSRLGYNCIDGKLHFYGYTRDGGKHSSIELKLGNDIKPGDNLFLMITEDHDRIHYYLDNQEVSDSQTHMKTNRYRKNSSKWSYFLRPYIGGNKPAVQDIKFEINNQW